ncbi:LUD domain-containing protein [Streptomyces sp. 35G-GA-8]|uniref:LutC/YkgG family protein n=1 Tax=Streptomyces sp. 35G-GA-8 TaxID=2939434 RepID=UPI00201F200B|nr:LUD domain-containing protein [Streptomyces sp. 35G-GA-8]MCL7378341.1 LUD domain-containing protein [Streptomyces sp. 35G-GA-8]
MSSRDIVLGRIRAALSDVPGEERPEDVPVPREYWAAHAPDDPGGLLDLLQDRLAEYRATVHRCDAAALPETVAAVLARRGARTVVVPEGLPAQWLTAFAATRLGDTPPLSPQACDTADSVVTSCALAIAETGTIVLDGGSGQGRRALSLIPDHHLCVVRAPEQVVASVPAAVARLAPTRPLTWISGPSATSDIELERVEGVHGPRTLDVVLVRG